MKAVFSSLTFPDFSDPATGMMCERKGRVRGNAQQLCSRRGRSGEPYPPSLRLHPSSKSVCCPCVSLCWPSRKLRSYHMRNWIWERPNSIPCASGCDVQWTGIFSCWSHSGLAMLSALIRATALFEGLGALQGLGVGKWVMVYMTEFST